MFEERVLKRRQRTVLQVAGTGGSVKLQRKKKEYYKDRKLSRAIVCVSSEHSSNTKESLSVSVTRGFEPTTVRREIFKSCFLQNVTQELGRGCNLGGACNMRKSVKKCVEDFTF